MGALKGLQQALRNMQGSSAVSASSIKQLKDQITAQKTKIAQSQEAYLKLGGSMSKFAAQTAEAKGGLLDLTKTTGGPLAGMIERGRGLVQSFGKAGAAGAIIAAAAAAMLLVTAIGAATAALAKFGLEAANAARAERLQLEGMTVAQKWMQRMWLGYSLGVDKASDLQAAINRVSSSVAIGRDKVVGYANELYRMGLRGKTLEAGLEATSIASSAAGEGYAGMIKGMMVGHALYGGSVQKMADTVKARFGGIARAQMLDLNTQLMKARENITGLFEELRIEGFLAGLQKMLDMFSEQSAMGAAIKVMLETLLNPLFDSVGRGAPIIKRFFQGITITALLFSIQILKLRLWMRDTFGDRKLFSGLDKLKVGLWAGKIAGGALVAVLVTLAAVLGICAVSIVVSFAPLTLLLTGIGATIIGIVHAVVWLVDAFKKAGVSIRGVGDWVKKAWEAIRGITWEDVGYSATRAIVAIDKMIFGFFTDLPDRVGRAIVSVDVAIFSGLSRLQEWLASFLARLPKAILAFDVWFFDAGRNIMDAIARGIRSAASAVLDAIKGVAKGAWKAFKDELGIHSPSRLFHGAGLNIGRGVIGGVRAEQPHVISAVAQIVPSPPLARTPLARASFEPTTAFPSAMTRTIAPLPMAFPPAMIGSMAPPPTASGGPPAHGGGKVEIHQLIVQAPAGANPKDFAEAIEHELARTLEGVAIQLGAIPIGTT
jgi:hypothetical protein